MILQGKLVARKIYLNFKKDLKLLKKKKIQPAMAVILVGEDPASLAYIKVKEKVAQRLGVDFKLFHLPAITPEKEVEKLIDDLNKNKYISGIIVQLPLPESFKTDKIIQKIKKEKDMDGFRGGYPAPTAQAILAMLKFYGFDLKDKKIVIVGYGRLVGQPLVKLLKKQGLKPIVCDSKTADLNQKTKGADILISATGIAGLVKPAMVRKEAIVIDAGATGDVDPLVYQKVQGYTPVPGGVGPVTVAILFSNLCKAAQKTEPQ